MVYDATDRLGDFFTSRRERGIANLPTLSVTLTNGLLPRDTLDRKMETNLSDEEHLLVRKDDIVYNMMRMWQGASGLSDRDGLLSPAYVVLAPKKGINPLYASYLFKSSRLIYLFWAYSYGLTGDRLRLYFNDFKSIPVNIPPIPEQRMIGHILSTWDKAIDKLKSLIAAKQRRKKALMQQLLTGKMRFPRHDGKWKEVRLSEISNIETGTSKSAFIDDLGDKFIIDMGAISREGKLIPSKKTSLSEDYLTIGQLVMPKDDIGGGNIIGRTGYIDQNNKYVFGDHVYKLTVIEGNSQFLSYLINSEKVNKSLRRKANGTAQLGLGKKDVLNQVVSVPLIDEQQKIAAVLSAADMEITTNQNQLAALQQQKIGLMQQLLTGKKRVNVNQAAA